MPADARKLSRILRVRTLQLGLTQADEARAVDRVASEMALRDRIARLADEADILPVTDLLDPFHYDPVVAPDTRIDEDTAIAPRGDGHRNAHRLAIAHEC